MSAKKESLNEMLHNAKVFLNPVNGGQKLRSEVLLEGNFQIYKIVFGEKEADKLTTGLGIYKKIDVDMIQKTFKEEM